MAYLRSTDVEQGNWHRLLWSVPDEWFWRWANGHSVALMDETTHPRGGKIERIFRPVFLDLMRVEVLRLEPEPQERQLMDHYRRAVAALRGDVSLGTRYRFWRGKIKHEPWFYVTSRVVARESNVVQRLGPEGDGSKEEEDFA
jgi:hypothetical protein